ncbi:MAG: ABC transporter ATP-binding protein, partial [Gammaproteobacteria bacterium]
IVVVSHDRHLLRSTVDTLLLVAHHKIEEFSGDLDDYQRWLTEFRRHQLSGKPIKEKSKPKKKSPAVAIPMKQLEHQLNQLTEQAKTIEAQLTDETLYRENNVRLPELLSEQKNIMAQLADVEKAWLEAAEKLA